jgi:hypothetical protein
LFAFTESRCETLVVAEVTWETGRNTWKENEKEEVLITESNWEGDRKNFYCEPKESDNWGVIYQQP